MHNVSYRGSLLVLLLLFSGMPAFSQDLSLYEKKQFTSSDGFTLPYRILLPEGYAEGKKYPLILVLHGAGERGSDNEKQLIHGSKLFLDSLIRKKHEAIVVFPQCPENSYWSSVEIDRNKAPLALDFDYSRPITRPLKASIELVRELLTKERIDERRVYITGLSMGGMGTFEAVHHYPNLFAAALPICGGGDTEHYRKVKTPFWVFHGSDDAVVNVRYSKEMVGKLKDVGAKVKYTEYPGVNHNSWDNAFAEPDFLPWMFKRKK
jgi:predicted peptidase